ANAMLNHLLAHGLISDIAGGIPRARFERWHIGGRIRWGDAGNVRHDPLAARGWWCAVGLRGGRQKRPLPGETPPPVKSRVKGDATKLASVNVRDAVVPGQTLVYEGEPCGQELGDFAVFADEGVEEQLHLAPHGLSERIVEVRIPHWERPHALESSQVQPLSSEVDRERYRSRAQKHPPNLLLQNDGVPQSLLAGEPD